jgi:hypothetical protein
MHVYKEYQLEHVEHIQAFSALSRQRSVDKTG